MTWTRLPLSEDPGVLITVNKKTVALSVCQPALYDLGWGASWKVAIELGDGEHVGWVRIVEDERGTGDEVSGRLVVSIARSTLPDLIEARIAPLVWRRVESALEVRLPTTAAISRPKPALRAVSVPQEDVHSVAVPEKYAALHSQAWASGLELVFLSNDTCLLDHRIVELGEVEREVRRVLVA